MILKSRGVALVSQLGLYFAFIRKMDFLSLLMYLCLLMPFSDVCIASLIKNNFQLNNFSKQCAPFGGLCTLFLVFLGFIFHFFPFAL